MTTAERLSQLLTERGLWRTAMRFYVGEEWERLADSWSAERDPDIRAGRAVVDLVDQATRGILYGLLCATIGARHITVTMCPGGEVWSEWDSPHGVVRIEANDYGEWVALALIAVMGKDDE